MIILIKNWRINMEKNIDFISLFIKNKYYIINIIIILVKLIIIY